MLDALRQVIHLRAYAQKKPIDEYKQEAFLLFERLLPRSARTSPGRSAGCAFTMQPPEDDFPEMPMPDFITHHIDPFTGDDDTRTSTPAPARSCRGFRRCVRPEMPAGSFEIAEADMPKVSRNAPCRAVRASSSSIATGSWRKGKGRRGRPAGLFRHPGEGRDPSENEHRRLFRAGVPACAGTTR
jgi:preprotein translocase subunit SecA